jgi:RNA polymerase sigma-70 factor (ECF subfamily)
MSQFSKFTPDEDAPLLISWHRGDISAFETLVRKYLQRVFSLAYYLTGNEESAATAAQGAFVTAFTTINSFNSRFHFANWLLTLTLKETRELLDYRDSVPPPNGLQSASLEELLARQIRQLPPELAEVLVLRDVRGYPLERIAEIYQLRNDTLVSRLFAAHETLAALQKGKGAPPGQAPTAATETVTPHPEIRRSFHAYLDSSLTAADADNIRKHLKSCGSCRDALTGLEWTIEHLKQLPDIPPPHRLTAVIMERVQAAPAIPEKEKSPPPSINLRRGVALLFILLTVLAAYLLLHDHGTPSRPVAGKEPAPSATTPPQPREQSGPAGFITSITAPFRSPGKPERAPENTAVPVPLPPPVHPAASAALPAKTPATTPVETKAKGDAAGKHSRSERPPELPGEWGESLSITRAPQKKQAPGRSRSSDVAVEMTTADPLAAIQEIENAVTSVGGKITGRAYSGGNDILYTSIDIDRFFDLMSRLGKTGKIQELPQPQEGAEGTVDLIIKWH